VTSGNLEAVRAVVEAASKPAFYGRAVVAAGGRAFQETLDLLHRNGADLNSVWRGYRALHALLEEAPHAHGGKPSPERLACLDWLLANGADRN